MKALSIRQPWASLLAYRFKTIETRTWNTNHRGKFYIHAGQKVDVNAMNYFKRLYKIPYPIGCLVGWGKLTGVKHYKTKQQFASDNIYHRVAEVYGPQSNRYGYVMDDLGVLARPVKCKGALRFFNLPKRLSPKIIEIHIK